MSIITALIAHKYLDEKSEDGTSKQKPYKFSRKSLKRIESIRKELAEISTEKLEDYRANFRKEWNELNKHLDPVAKEAARLQLNEMLPQLKL